MVPWDVLTDPFFDNGTSLPKISLPGYLTIVCNFCTVLKKRKGRVTSKEKQRKTLSLPIRLGSNNETPVQKCDLFSIMLLL
jgi:hypothetical protein